MNRLLFEDLAAHLENVHIEPPKSSSGLSAKENLLRDKIMREVLRQRVLEARVFVANKQVVNDALDHSLDAHIPYELSLPFPTVWLEPNDGTALMIEETERGDIRILGILLYHLDVEIEGKKFLSPSAIRVVDEGTRDGQYLDFQAVKKEEFDGTGYTWHLFAFHFFNQLTKKCAVGTETVNKRMRIGTGNNRQVLKINKIVHCVPKQSRAKGVDVNRKIDWSHSWEVMGHWRKHDGIGKDRRGEYVVKGYTWVNPFTKGKGDLVKKLRLLRQTSTKI